MKFSTVSVAAIASAALTVFASTAGAANAQTPVPSGPALPGVCVLNKDRMIVGSVVGKSVLSRLDQLKAQADAELSSESSAIEADAKALEAQQSTLPADQYQQRGGLINQRVQALQHKAQLRQAELGKTQEKALGRIGSEVDPIVRQVFTQRSCSLMLDSAALIYPAPTMDVTDAVIHGLDAKIQQFPFDREHLDQNGAPAR